MGRLSDEQNLYNQGPGVLVSNKPIESRTMSFLRLAYKRSLWHVIKPRNNDAMWKKKKRKKKKKQIGGRFGSIVHFALFFWFHHIILPITRPLLHITLLIYFSTIRAPIFPLLRLQRVLYLFFIKPLETVRFFFSFYTHLVNPAPTYISIIIIVIITTS